jgi:thiol-disulfide isomerase/thioredoxin
MNDPCRLLASEKELNQEIKNKERLFVMFYASWCPYSQAFLPHFIDSAKENELCHMRILVDDQADLVDKYNIEVFPSVIFFCNGRVAARLDGIPHQGLTAAQLKKFIHSCNEKK